MDTTRTTIVVGGGCSGALAAIHLLRARERVVLVDPGPEQALGRGAAYRTTDPAHLLNSRAAAMSVLAEAPDDFLTWCRDQDIQLAATDFAPRRVFGDYIHARLREAIDGADFRHVRASAARVGNRRVLLRGGGETAGDRVVLALGHGAPTGPLAITSAVQTHPHYVGNPWAPGALDRIPLDVPVLLIGTGLTALDVAITLARRGRAGTAPLYAISRRGLLPQAHLPEPVPVTTEFSYRGSSVHGLLRAVRTYAAGTGDWRGAVDALRPQLDRLWWQLPAEARQQFLQHVAAYWEVHRHRMAPSVAAQVTAMREAGTLRTRAAVIQAIRRGERGFVVTLRKAGAYESWPVGAIVNCAGPGGATTSALGRALLDDGLARRDATGTGLDVDGAGRLIARDGSSQDDLLAIGPTRRGAWWETTAVPEIRTQAAGLTGGAPR